MASPSAPLVADCAAFGLPPPSLLACVVRPLRAALPDSHSVWRGAATAAPAQVTPLCERRRMAPQLSPPGIPRSRLRALTVSARPPPSRVGASSFGDPFCVLGLGDVLAWDSQTWRGRRAAWRLWVTPFRCALCHPHASVVIRSCFCSMPARLGALPNVATLCLVRRVWRSGVSAISRALL